MKVRFYNFSQEVATELSKQIKLYYAQVSFIDVIYFDEDSSTNRQKLRSILKDVTRPSVLVSNDKSFAELCWQLNIDQFVHLENGFNETSYQHIQKGIQLCLTRNEFYLKKISVNSQEGINSIALKEIAYVMADGSYSKIVTNQHEILVSKKLKHFQDTLCEMPNFHRFGRSLIVNVDRVASVVDRQVKFDNGVTVSFPKSGNSFKELKNLLLWKR